MAEPRVKDVVAWIEALLGPRALEAAERLEALPQGWLEEHSLPRKRFAPLVPGLARTSRQFFVPRTGVVRAAQRSVVRRHRWWMRRRIVLLASVLGCASVLACGPAPPSGGKASHVPEHAVIVHLKLSNAAFGTKEEMDAIHALSDRLEAKILEARAGEFDGDEFGQGECTLYMYGPNADLLFAAVEDEIRASPLSRGGWVIKRYGSAEDKEAKETRINLDAG